MTEILTESFCERCGTRYTFESAAPKRPRLRGLKVIGRGLKNFVLSDDSSLDEALAAARSEAEYEVTTHQLDAFHRTFNFCMTCRQYTCENCWDPVEARCLTCAPDGEKARAVAAAEAAAAAAAEAEAARAKAMIGTWPVAEFIHDEVVPESVASVEPGEIDALFARAAEAPPEEAAGPELEPTLAPAASLETATTEPAEAAQHAAEALEPTAAPEVVRAPDVVTADEVATDGLAAPAETAPAETEPATVEIALTATAEIEPVTPAETVSVGTPDTLPAEAGPAIAQAAPVEAEAAAPEQAAPSQLAAPVEAVEAGPPAEYTPAPSPEAPASPAPPPATSAAQPAPAQPPYQRSIRRYRPGQSLDDEIAAYEAGLAAGLSRGAAVASREASPTPGVAEATPIEPGAAIEAPVAMAPEPTVATVPEPVAAAAAPTPPETPADLGTDGEAAPSLPEPMSVVTPPLFTPPVSRPSVPPAWPTGARWPTAPSAPTVRDSSTGTPVVDPLAAALARRATDAMWAQSATELLQAQPIPVAPAAPVAGVQSCQKCGLSLSATARFCRRCGTRQES